MIQEITRFIDHLEEDSSGIFSENIVLKDGLYFLLEKKGDKLVINYNESLLVNKKTEKGSLYNKFLSLYSNSEMITGKSLNSIEKIFIDVGSPFAVSISGKGIKPDSVKGESINNRKEKQKNAIAAYEKALDSYIDWDEEDDKALIDMHADFKTFLEDDLQNVLYGENNVLELNKDSKKWEYTFSFREESISVKDTFVFYFFMAEPEVEDYSEFHKKYLSQKVFLNDLKEKETHGISNDLNVGNVDKKPFSRHKTAPFDINYRVAGETARKLYKFFRLQQKNKVLPNPMPLFIDKNEITQDAIAFYKEDSKRGHQEIIELLLNEKSADLSNYYLIYFHNGYKGSRIVDFDFVSKFRYKTEDMPSIAPVFNVKQKGDMLFRAFAIKNIFHFQSAVLNVLFNKQLLQETKNGLWIKYFDDIEEKSEYGATAVIVNLFYKYRRAIYDYIYKSREDAITFSMFNEICIESILDDINHDKKEDKTTRIKEKLNIWFSLYNYFNNKNLDDMVNKTKELLLRVKEVANTKEMHLESDEEFAFASGQLIRTILNKSESGERSHALLEPFLQKTQDDKFKLAIARAFENYKHAFKFYKGDDKRYSFDKIMSEVMGANVKVNLKDLLPMILAGYFSESIFINSDKQ